MTKEELANKFLDIMKEHNGGNYEGCEISFSEILKESGELLDKLEDLATEFWDEETINETE